MAQVHRSSLEKGVGQVKLGVSFPDASCWEHWEAPGPEGHKPGPAMWMQRAPCRAPGLGAEPLYFRQKSFVQLLRAKSRPWEGVTQLRQDAPNTQAPVPRTELQTDIKRS